MSGARRFPLLFTVLVLLQLGLWTRTNHMLPDISVVPDVPREQAVKALAFGDEEFFFRAVGLEIQNCGDTFGRFVALYKYDFHKLYQWFLLLDTLNSRSVFIPTVATYYFAQTQNTPDVRYIVDYLYQHSATSVERNWWWLVQAIYLANHRLEDKPLALKIAKPLATAKNIPIFAQQMPAFIYEQLGEYQDALVIMEGIQKDIKHIPPGELQFMRYFIDERLKSMEQRQKRATLMH